MAISSAKLERRIVPVRGLQGVEELLRVQRQQTGFLQQPATRQPLLFKSDLLLDLLQFLAESRQRLVTGGNRRPEAEVPDGRP